MRLQVATLVVVLCAHGLPATAQVLALAELNTEQIRALDRARTVVIIPGGILEEHGPYLPSYSDGYFNERLARDLAEAVVARPGWTAVRFPSVPLGSGGANEIGRQYSFPGSYGVRAATVRAVFMDLAAELGDQGFRWVFVVHAHGSPHHNRALDEAGAFFHDTYGGQMVNLTGLEEPDVPAPPPLLSGEAAREDGFSVHAGAMEHSTLMFLRPDLVPPAVAQAPSVTRSDFAGLVEAARRKDWPGYFGAPRHASAALGAARYSQNRDRSVARMNRILDGWDPSRAPRYWQRMMRNPDVASVVDDALAHDREQEAKQQEWLRTKAAAAFAAAPPR